MPERFVVNVEGAVFNEQGQWLMVVRSDQEAHAGGDLSLAGGTVDHADADTNILEEALQREFAEEVGVTLGAMRYVRSTQFVSDTGEHVLDIVFTGPHLSGEPEVLDAAENSWVGWMTLDAIMEDPRAKPWTLASVKAAEQIRSDWK